MGPLGEVLLGTLLWWIREPITIIPLLNIVIGKQGSLLYIQNTKQILKRFCSRDIFLKLSWHSFEKLSYNKEARHHNKL